MNVLARPVDIHRIRVFERPWATAGETALVGGLLGFLYYPTLLQLGRQWYSDPDYSHGFLVPLVSAYLVWERRRQLQALRPRSSFVGLVAIVGGLSLFVLSAHAGTLFVQRLSLLIVLAGLVSWILGPEFRRVLTVPLVMLLFMIPPPGIFFAAITSPLQSFAAHVAGQTLAALGIPVLREGNVITLANTSLEVAEACSGIRSVITLMAAAATFACVTGASRWRALTLVAISIPIAVVANAARVAGTGVLAYHYGSSAAEGFLHTMSGWLLFVGAAALLALVGLIVSVIPSKRGPGEAALVRAASPGAGPDLRRSGLTWRLGLSAAMIALALVAVGTASPGEAVALRRPFDSFPNSIGAWEGTREALPSSILDVLGATDYVNRLYVKRGAIPIWLYVAYYETQRQGHTIHSPKVCIPGGGWSIRSHRYLTVTLPGRAQPATINRVLISKESERQIVLYWNQERGRILAHEYAAWLYILADAVRSKRTDGALVRITAPVTGSEEATVAQMLDFASAIYPDLVHSLPE